MDLLGTKALAQKIEDALGVSLPKADADLEKLGAVLDEAGIFLGEATDLVKDLDAAVESVPAEFRSLAQAGRAALDHFVRVGTRGSNAAQEIHACVADVRAFLAELRAGKIKFVTETRIAKP